MKAVICCMNSKFIHSSLAPWYLKASVDKYCKDGECEVYETTINENKDKIVGELLKMEADLIAFSVYIWNVSLVVEISREIRSKKNVKIAFGGPEVSYNAKSILEKYNFVDYKGVIQPNEIHQTLNDYDLMLLPTHYFTEGLPGSIVDAYISGIPVIATEWKHSREFIDDGYSGYIIPFENGEMSLIEKVILLNKDRNLLKQMQLNALEKRKEFTPPLLSRYIG